MLPRPPDQSASGFVGFALIAAGSGLQAVYNEGAGHVDQMNHGKGQMPCLACMLIGAFIGHRGGAMEQGIGMGQGMM